MTNTKEVIKYYSTKESRIGYKLFLKGTKHFGYYEKGDLSISFSKALRKMEHKIGDKLGKKPNSVILDAGCGMGIVSRNLTKWYGYKIIGIDILDFNIKKAKKNAKEISNLAPKLDYRLMDYHNLKFKGNYFDGIYTMETLVRSSSPKKALQEFYRTLKPGGKLVQLEYAHTPFSQMTSKEADKFKLVNKYAAMPAFNKFEYGMHEKILKETGFKNISTEKCMPNITPMLKWLMIFAWLPVKFIKLFHQEKRFINAVSAVEFWKLRDKIEVNIIKAEKPL